MKILFQVILLALLANTISAQEIEFEVKVSSDTILIGNYVELSFEIRNGEGKFAAPDFAGLIIVGGPNKASSYSIINGVISQSSNYSYYLEAENPGTYTIESATLISNGKEYKTPEIKLVFADNPDGRKQFPNYRSEPNLQKKEDKPKRKATKL